MHFTKCGHSDSAYFWAHNLWFTARSGDTAIASRPHFWSLAQVHIWGQRSKVIAAADQRTTPLFSIFFAYPTPSISANLDYLLPYVTVVIVPECAITSLSNV